MWSADEFYDDDTTSGIFPVADEREFDRHPRTAPYRDPFPCSCDPVGDCPHGEDIAAWLERHGAP